MGILSGLSDSLFGDKGKKATRAQVTENRANREFIKEGIAAGKADIERIFPQAQAARLFGAQGAQDIFAAAVPQQFQQFQQGNVQAQGTAGSAPQQIQNALLGLPVDFGFLQPQQTQAPDFSFLSQPLQAPQPQQQPQTGFGGIGNEAGQNPFNLQFLNNRINPFGGGF